MPRLGTIELSQLPAFTVLQQIDFEAILQARMLLLKQYWASNDPPMGAQYDVDGLEFDPLKINQETASYLEVMLRDRVNQAARAVTLAFAVGGDLDAIASRYPGGMPRLPAEQGTPPTALQDTAYRTRIWLSVNTLSPHGTYESYVFWALNAYAQFNDPILRDAQVSGGNGSPNILITIMSDGAPVALNGTTYDGADAGRMIGPYPSPTPPNTQLINTWNYIKDPAFARKGLTDVVTVGAPAIVQVPYDIGITLYPGWDDGLIMPQLAGALATLLESQRWLGFSHTRAAIDAALKVGGVFNVQINAPAADVIIPVTSTIVVPSVSLRFIGRGGVESLTST